MSFPQVNGVYRVEKTGAKPNLLYAHYQFTKGTTQAAIQKLILTFFKDKSRLNCVTIYFS